jgi:hypothetical protein
MIAIDQTGILQDSSITSSQLAGLYLLYGRFYNEKPPEVSLRNYQIV